MARKKKPSSYIPCVSQTSGSLGPEFPGTSGTPFLSPFRKAHALESNDRPFKNATTEQLREEIRAHELRLSELRRIYPAHSDPWKPNAAQQEIAASIEQEEPLTQMLKLELSHPDRLESSPQTATGRAALLTDSTHKQECEQEVGLLHPAPKMESARSKKPTKKSQRIKRATAAIATLWVETPNATYKDIVSLADKRAVEVPWKGCANWEAAQANCEAAVKTLLAKARNTARTLDASLEK